ncbi:GIY-YIG nuclease family protein [Ramlibacter humi]|uniref:GIY-YIG nuclease family protein n=1 Tax=Ramlibacter humi TaxID=2530451 RepID=A0A4Z0CA26_9BURK|nr:GIY-YIG nuclease family protein [Ramlibacter humi]TFZ07844.1 GIY-YIG nuclease family protein [Ramlibacter humi]
MASPADTSARRRELSRAARDAFPPMGVYAIRNLETGATQVAASRNVPGAINRVNFELRQRTHRDRALQGAWDRLGEQGVRIDVLEMVRERSDPTFDHDAELAALLELWRAELQA